MNSADDHQGQIQETPSTTPSTDTQADTETDPNADLIGYVYKGRVNFKVTETMPGNSQYVHVDMLDDEGEVTLKSARVAAHVRALKMAVPNG